MNNILTSSRQLCLLSCPRKHYWQFEIGLQSESSGLALRFGSAWHRAMEARWKGAIYEEALSAAVAPDMQLDEYTVATISGLLAGYYSTYESDVDIRIVPEIEFNYSLEGSRTFSVAGKIDGMGLRLYCDSANVLVESKTTGDSVEANSDYWLRLRFNTQVYQYVLAARQMGHDVSEVIYDVVRKPSIRPKHVDDLDENGAKTVLDSVTGNRVFNKDGTPRQTGGKSFTVLSHLETPDEYCNRLIADCKSRPEFYFARREVPILEDELKSFEAQRLTLSRIILEYRQLEKRVTVPQDAWPRNVSENTCSFCQYSSFCMQNIQPTAAFQVKPFNPELESTI